MSTISHSASARAEIEYLRAQLEAALARAEAAEQKVKELEARVRELGFDRSELIRTVAAIADQASCEAQALIEDPSLVRKWPDLAAKTARELGVAKERARIREGLEKLQRLGPSAWDGTPLPQSDGEWLRRADALALVEKP